MLVSKNSKNAYNGSNLRDPIKVKENLNLRFSQNSSKERIKELDKFISVHKLKARKILNMSQARRTNRKEIRTDSKAQRHASKKHKRIFDDDDVIERLDIRLSPHKKVNLIQHNRSFDAGSQETILGQVVIIPDHL